MKLHAFAAAATAFATLALANSVQAQTLLRDTEIEHVLHDYSHPIFVAAGLPADAVGIHLIGDPSINAFVANGLNMYIQTGLIEAADTPNEVIGVIAHETGHMAGGHLARSDAAISSATRPMLLSLLLGVGAIAAGSPDAGMAALALGQTVGQANYLRFSRGQESSADQAAVTYLNQVGRSPIGLEQFFEKLRNYELLSSRAPNPFFQTHPLSTARIAALHARIEASPYLDKTDTPAEQHEFDMIKAKIRGFMQDPNVTLRQYPLSDTSDPARYARAVAYYRTANLDRALHEIGTLLTEHPDNPYFWELKGQMLFESGKVQESIAPHAKSVELAPAEPLLLINLGRAYVATENPDYYDKAVAELKAALLIEPDNSFGWSELARAYDGLGNPAMADYATAEARFAVGAASDAYQFAMRARDKLPKDSTEWRKAGDIMLASQDAAQRAQRRGERNIDERASGPSGLQFSIRGER